jgi:hypothetical protein
MKRAALVASLAVAALAASPRGARAHGGVPVSQKILRQAGGDTMYVPVVFWGVWVGTPSGPWRWICEEAINPYRGRHIQLSTDGTFYATDNVGMQVSTDHGCTWTTISGSEPATLKLTDVAVDATDGATAYVTSGSVGPTDADGAQQPPSNALFITHDHGQTFLRAPGLASLAARQFQSVKLSADGQSIYVTSTTGETPFSPMVHRSTDGGMTFTSNPVNFMIGGFGAYELDVLGIDPRDATVIYVRALVPGLDVDGGPLTHEALLRSIDGGATFAQVLTQDAVVSSSSGTSRGIDSVAVDVPNHRVLVATAAGLYGADDAGRAPTITLAPESALTQAQCVDVHNGTTYVCSSNYAPDLMAIGSSTDGAHTFQKVLQYVDTLGPVNCPAGTPVGDTCPMIWSYYGSQLGITFDDGGVPDGGMQPPPSGCSCGLGSRAASATGASLLGALALFTLVARGLSSRRRRPWR